jgi:hypothetical protein
LYLANGFELTGDAESVVVLRVTTTSRQPRRSGPSSVSSPKVVPERLGELAVAVESLPSHPELAAGEGDLDEVLVDREISLTDIPREARADDRAGGGAADEVEEVTEAELLTPLPVAWASCCSSL